MRINDLHKACIDAAREPGVRFDQWAQQGHGGRLDIADNLHSMRIGNGYGRQPNGLQRGCGKFKPIEGVLTLLLCGQTFDVKRQIGCRKTRLPHFNGDVAIG